MPVSVTEQTKQPSASSPSTTERDHAFNQFLQDDFAHIQALTSGPSKNHLIPGDYLGLGNVLTDPTALAAVRKLLGAGEADGTHIRVSKYRTLGANTDTWSISLVSKNGDRFGSAEINPQSQKLEDYTPASTFSQSNRVEGAMAKVIEKHDAFFTKALKDPTSVDKKALDAAYAEVRAALGISPEDKVKLIEPMKLIRSVQGTLNITYNFKIERADGSRIDISAKPPGERPMIIYGSSIEEAREAAEQATRRLSAKLPARNGNAPVALPPLRGKDSTPQ